MPILLVNTLLLLNITVSRDHLHAKTPRPNASLFRLGQRATRARFERQLYELQTVFSA